MLDIFRKALYAVVGTFLVLATGANMAAKAEIPVSIAPTASTLNTFSESDFNQTSSSIIWTKLRRFFTRNPQKDAELTQAIRNTLLVQVNEQLQAGEINNATDILTKVLRETVFLEKLVTTLQTQTDNTEVQSFFNSFVTDRALELALLEDSLVRGEGSSQLAEKLLSEQAKVIRDIVAVLERETDPARQSEKLNQIFNRYTQKLAQIEQKVAKKLTLTADLDAASDDAGLERELDKQEDSILESTTAFDESQIRELSRLLGELEPTERLIVLTKLLETVPAASQVELETALNSLTEQILSENGGDANRLRSTLETSRRSSAVQERIIERLKEHADEATKQRLEDIKEAIEAEREAAKQAAERERNDNQDTDDDANEEDSTDTNQEDDTTDDDDLKLSPNDTEEADTETATPRPTSSSTASPTSSTTTNSARETLEIKVKNGVFGKTTFTVEQGTIITLKFKNEDETSRTLTLSNGISSRPIAAGEASLTSFTADQGVTFTCTGVSGSGTIQIQIN
jgi:hypothetical protein